MAPQDDRKINIIIQAQDAAASALSGLTKHLTTIAGVAAAAGAAVAALGVALVKVTEAAARQEDADVRLAVALASINENSETARTALGRLASRMEEATTVDDEAIQEMMATLIQLGRVGTREIERVASATIELAAVTGQDLASAATLMSKAAQGNTAAFWRYGIVLDENVPKAQRFEAILARFDNGMQTATATGQTLSGQMRRLGNDWDNFKQAVGESVIESQAFRDLIEIVHRLMKNLITAVDENREAIDNWVEAIVIWVATFTKLGASIAEFMASASKLDRPFERLIDRITGSELEEANKKIEQGLADAFRSAADAAEELLAKLRTPKSLNDLLITMHRQGEAAVDVAGKIRNFGASVSTVVTPAMKLNDVLKSLGIETMAELKQKTEDVDEALRLLADAQAKAVDPSVFDETIASLIALTEQLPAWSTELGQLFEVAKTGSADVLSLADEIALTLEGVATDSALSFSDTMIDAAFGAKVSWRDFFKQLLADLLKAIARALILRAIMGIATGGGSLVAGQAAGAGGASLGGGLVGAKHGGVVRGGFQGVDSVAAMLAPGEIVLPADTARDFRTIAEVARGGQRAQSIDNSRSISMPITIVSRGRDEAEVADLIQAITDLVERKNYRLVATATVPA